MVGYVDLDDGSDVSFEINGGFYSEYYSYLVEDEEGNVLVDQVEQYVPAENTYNVVVCATSSVDESMGPSDIRFVPNPAETSVRLTGLSGGESWTLTVRTLLGQTVLTTEGTGQQTVDLSSLPAGSYVGQLQAENGAATSLRLVVR